jgi:hypothetical protein
MTTTDREQQPGVSYLKGRVGAEAEATHGSGMPRRSRSALRTSFRNGVRSASG